MSLAGNERMEATLSEVLQQAQAGSSDAFAELYRWFYPRVLGLCRYLLSSRTEAEDAAGEVFTRLPKALKSWDMSRAFPQGLLSIASHYYVDVLRRRHVEMRVFEPTDSEALRRLSGDPSPLESLLSREQGDELVSRQRPGLPLQPGYTGGLESSQ